VGGKPTHIHKVIIMTKIKIDVTKKLSVKPENLFSATVKQLGNSGYVPVKKSFIGKDVYVIIKDDNKEEK
jgi:putative transposon-encoded protein